jgi:hypothetical protein
LFGEIRVFGKESISRVDSIDVRYFCGADDSIGSEVALGALRATYADGFVG